MTFTMRICHLRITLRLLHTQIWLLFFCCGINFPILSAVHISRIQNIALLCLHPLISDLLSTYLMVSFILS